MEKINKNDPQFNGMYIELSEDQTELALPPMREFVEEIRDVSASDNSNPQPYGCDRKVKVTENGNIKYAWYYLTNDGNKYAGVTIEKSWDYKGQRRRATERHRLYPGEVKNVFNFPRRQNPACGITKCAFE